MINIKGGKVAKVETVIPLTQDQAAQVEAAAVNLRRSPEDVLSDILVDVVMTSRTFDQVVSCYCGR